RSPRGRPGKAPPVDAREPDLPARSVRSSRTPTLVRRRGCWPAAEALTVARDRPHRGSRLSIGNPSAIGAPSYDGRYGADAIVWSSLWTPSDGTHGPRRDRGAEQLLELLRRHRPAEIEPL